MLEALAKPAQQALCFLLLTAPPLAAQFAVEGRPVQIHGFVSQGYAYSNNNNYLTMDTSKGSFVFTDAGINTAAAITDQFRVGAQAYIRNIGQLGRGHITLDWISGDYHFTDWLGLRAGKVKTVVGLHNDTQDAEFLHTWALLPQSLYPLDLRETTLAHLGVDVYGTVPIPKLGELSYTVYGGRGVYDDFGGYAYQTGAEGFKNRSFSGSANGVDLRWSSLLPGLLIGASYLNTPILIRGTYLPAATFFEFDQRADKRVVYYAQYIHNNLRLEGEYGRDVLRLVGTGLAGPYGPPVISTTFDRRAWYASLAYRLNKRLEIGTYNSRYFPNADHINPYLPDSISPVGRHVFDQTVTARIDLSQYFDLKIEGHFVDGHGDTLSFRGFYPVDNPAGLKPKTNLLILRMGFSF